MMGADADRLKELDPVAGDDEARRAFRHFEAVVAVHRAIVDSTLLMAGLPDAIDHLYGSYRVRQGFAGQFDDQKLRDRAGFVHETLQQEKERDFAVVRSATLVAICGAFEYLVKAVFVAQAAFAPEDAIRKIGGSKIKLNATEVLTTDSMEQWRVVADRFAGIEPAMVNEAFLLRNCLVHNGGRVSASLKRASKSWPERGAVIRLDSSTLERSIDALRKLAEPLPSLWLMEDLPGGD